MTHLPVKRLTLKRLSLKPVIAALLVSATPVMALDLDAMTAEEKTAFGQAVRDYLMENPQVLIDSINVLEEQRATAEAANDDQLIADNSAAIFDDGYSWVGGNPEGSLTIVEFIDYRCGVCRRFDAEVRDLVAADGDIRFVQKEFPILGPDSEASSRFAVAVKQIAGDGAYDAAHHALIDMRGPATPDALRAVAEKIGLDADAVMARMNSQDVTAVLTDTRDLAQRMAIQGTPTFVVGDTLLRGVPADGIAASVAQIRDRMAAQQPG